MEFYKVFLSFLTILNQSTKLLLKNGKSMASIAIISHFLLSVFVLLYSYTIKSLLLNDPIMDPYIPISPTPTTRFNPSQTTGLLQPVLTYFSFLVFLFVFLLISNLSSVATILISAVSCSDTTISFQDFFSRIRKAWTRSRVTSIIMSFSRIEIYWLFVGLVGAISLDHITILIAILIGMIVFFVWFWYISVVCVLAVIVSVVEESCNGKKAFEKAEQLVKGQKIHGFLLHFFFNLLVLILFLVYWLILGDKGFLNLTVFRLFVVNISSLEKMFTEVAYTVLYFQCKNRNGEKIEFLGILEDSKLSNDIP